MFFDQTLASQFHRDGFLVIPDFISQNALADLQTLYRKYPPELEMQGRGIYSNIEEQPKPVNKMIEQTIYSAFSPQLNKIFKNYKIYGGSFLIKGYGDNTATSLHQDWTAVDEANYPAFSIWIPLQDVSITTGCLTVVRGSHHWAETIRGVNFPSIYISMDGPAAKYTSTLPIKVGEAVVFSMNVFHGSTENLQGFQRPAMHLALAHADANLVHYLYQPSSNSFDVIDCNNDLLYNFIFEMKSGRLPESAKILRQIPNSVQKRMEEDQWLDLAAKCFEN